MKSSTQYRPRFLSLKESQAWQAIILTGLQKVFCWTCPKLKLRPNLEKISSGQAKAGSRAFVGAI